MKILVDVKEQPKKGSILMYNGEQYVAVAKDVFLDQIYVVKKRVEQLEKQVQQLELENKYSKGEITVEEYNNGLGNH